MSWLGAAMFAVAMAVMVATALPIYAVLLGTAAAFAALLRERFSAVRTAPPSTR